MRLFPQETEEEMRRPFLYRYFVRIPKAGQISFFDGSWMDEVTYEYLHGEIPIRNSTSHILPVSSDLRDS